MKLSESIRHAMSMSGRSVYQLAFATHIDEGSLRRFLKGETGLSQKALDRIASHLALKVLDPNNQAGGNERR
jgi:hypothetical protein